MESAQAVGGLVKGDIGCFRHRWISCSLVDTSWRARLQACPLYIQSGATARGTIVVPNYDL
jgi:hypothetical protein